MKRLLKSKFGWASDLDYWAIVDRVGSAIRSSLQGNLDEVLAAAMKELAEALGASRCAIALNQDGEVRYRADYGAPGVKSLTGLRSRLGETDAAKSFEERAELLEIPDVLEAAREQGVSERLLDASVKSALVVPLVINSKTIGAITIHQCDKKRRWSKHEKQLVQVIASNLALAIFQFELLIAKK